MKSARAGVSGPACYDPAATASWPAPQAPEQRCAWHLRRCSCQLFIGTAGEVTRLYPRDLASFDDPRPIAGTEDVQHATFSPDAR